MHCGHATSGHGPLLPFRSKAIACLQTLGGIAYCLACCAQRHPRLCLAGHGVPRTEGCEVQGAGEPARPSPSEDLQELPEDQLGQGDSLGA